MVKEDAIRRKEPIPLPVVSCHPVGIDLGRSIGTLRLERGCLILGRRRRTEHFTGRGLVETGLDAASTDGLKNAGCPQPGHISGKFGHVKADPDVALGGQMINLIRFDIVN